MQARYYDPVIGRFYSNDPVGTMGHLSGGNIQGFNRYAYANNNPYKYVDPDGNNPRRALFRVLKDPVHSAKQGFRKARRFLRDNGVLAPAPVRNEGVVNGDVPVSPDIDPADVAGKTPDEIDDIAGEHGLESKGPDPKSGQGAYTDPVTGKQRILVHPNPKTGDCGAHCHVNDADGNRLDIDGNVVEPESPDSNRTGTM